MPGDEEEYEVPSGGAAKRGEIELSRGIVIMPPERMKREQEAKEEERAEKAKPEEPKPIEKRPIAQRPAAGLGPSSSNVLAVAALVIALAALGFAFLTLNSYNQLRAELKGVVADLEEFRSSSFTLNAELTAEHTVLEDIPVRDVLTPVSIPVNKLLTVEGNFSVYNPATRQFDTQPYSGNITVRGEIDIDPTTLDPGRRLHLNYTIPGKGNMTLSIPVSRIWTSGLDDMLARLARIAG